MEALEAKENATRCRFLTTDPRVMAFYAEKFPWISNQFPAVLSHRSAVSTELHRIITRSAKDGTGSHKVEATMKENRCLERSRMMLIFYSLQSWEQRRPRFHWSKEEAAMQKTGEFKHHFDVGVSDVSDTYVSAMVNSYYDQVERYILQFFEQRVFFENDDVASIDHNLKRTWHLKYQGVRMYNHCLRAMNSWGGIVWSVNANTTSMGDPDVVDAVKRQQAAVKSFNLPGSSCKAGPRVVIYVDKPNQDGPGACRLFGCDSNGNQAEEQLLFPGTAPPHPPTHPLCSHCAFRLSLTPAEHACHEMIG